MPDDRKPAAGLIRSGVRVASGFALALVIALCTYLLLSMTSGLNLWFASAWFLGLAPAALCALICHIGDPQRSWPVWGYWLVPAALVAMVDMLSLALLREGLICLVMLTPIWLLSGWLGAFYVRRSSASRRGRKVLHSSLLVIPLVAAVTEAQVPFPRETVLLTRSRVVEASPAQIWPYLVATKSIAPNEGHWTVSHDLLGVPRPIGAAIAGQGIGAIRTAYWGEGVKFQEQVTQWSPGRTLAWRFGFSDRSLQDHTDRHISPDGPFLKIDSGDYTLRPITADRTLVTLNTRYIAMTHVNPYARLWGEVLLGDVQDNVLEIVKVRAEGGLARSD